MFRLKDVVKGACLMLVSIASVAEAEDWIWLPEKNVISNSVWTLNAYEKDGVLYVGNGSSAGAGNAFTGRGAGELDLSTPVVSHETDDTTRNWDIVGFQLYAFASDGSHPQVVTKFVFPKTTLNVSGQMFYANPNSTVLKEVVLEAPDCAGTTGSLAFYGNTGVTKFTLKAPRLEGLGEKLINSALSSTDFTQWELPAVKTLGRLALTFNLGTGKLLLPFLNFLDENALLQVANCTEMEFGTQYTLGDAPALMLRANAVNGHLDTQNSKLKRLVLGPYRRFDFADGALETAFLHNGNLTEIVFEGRVPENAREALDAVLISFGTSIAMRDKTKQVVIYASRNLGWSEIAASYTEVEKAKRPDGISDADCMGVYEKEGVPVAWLVHRTSEKEYLPLHVQTRDARFNDTFEVVQGDTRDGKYRIGSELTIRAVCDETTFWGWEGLPAGADTNGLEATFVFDEHTANILLKTAPRWTYLPDEGIISNRVWSLRVTRDQLDEGCLRVGKINEMSSGYAGRGEGILDLSGDITSTGESAWAITHLGEHALAVSGDSNVQTNPIVRFVFPRTTTSIGTGFIRAHSPKSNDGAQHANVVSHLEEVVMDIPNFEGTIGDYVFVRNSRLKKMHVNAPRMTGIGKQTFYPLAGLDSSNDLSTWNMENVRSIKSAGLMTCYARGCLKMSSLTTIESGGLGELRDLQELDLGSRLTPTDKQSLTVGNLGLRSPNAVTSVVFGAYTKLERPNPDAAGDIQFPKLKYVRFLGGVPENVTDFVDAVLLKRGVPVMPTDYAVIRASDAFRWSRMAVPVNEDDAAEKTAAAELVSTLPAGENLMGVYVNGNTQRVAWLVHSKSPYDPKPFLLILR